jgi:hypothetical protein
MWIGLKGTQKNITKHQKTSCFIKNKNTSTKQEKTSRKSGEKGSSRNISPKLE